MLSNVKSTRIKVDDIAIRELNAVPISLLKPSDKKQLLQNFFGDERVQILVSQILIKQATTNNAQVIPNPTHN